MNKTGISSGKGSNEMIELIREMGGIIILDPRPRHVTGTIVKDISSIYQKLE